MMLPFVRQIHIIEAVLATGFVSKQGKINRWLICLSLGAGSICDYLCSLTFLVPLVGGNLKAWKRSDGIEQFIGDCNRGTGKIVLLCLGTWQEHETKSASSLYCCTLQDIMLVSVIIPNGTDFNLISFTCRLHNSITTYKSKWGGWICHYLKVTEVLA